MDQNPKHGFQNWLRGPTTPVHLPGSAPACPRCHVRGLLAPLPPADQGTSGISFLVASPAPGRACPLHATGTAALPSRVTKCEHCGSRAPIRMLPCHTELKGLRDDVGAGRRFQAPKADRTRETVALPLPACVALGMSCHPVSLRLGFLKSKAGWSLSPRVTVRIHYRWPLLLLLLLLLSSPSPSDRQAESLIPRTQNCSVFEHSSFGAATSCSKGADREVSVKTAGEKPVQSRRMPSKPSDVA